MQFADNTTSSSSEEYIGGEKKIITTTTIRTCLCRPRILFSCIFFRPLKAMANFAIAAIGAIPLQRQVGNSAQFNPLLSRFFFLLSDITIIIMTRRYVESTWMEKINNNKMKSPTTTTILSIPVPLLLVHTSHSHRTHHFITFRPSRFFANFQDERPQREKWKKKRKKTQKRNAEIASRNCVFPDGTA